MPAASRIRARLSRTLLLQAGFIGLAALVSVFLVNVVIEGVLIRRALEDEAAFYWSRHDLNPAHPLPQTLNLTGYVGKAPAQIAALAPGFHDWNDGPHRNVVFVSERAGERLTLVFDRSGVARLTALFGLLPLALVLLVLYVSTWLAFRASKRAFSPVIELARQVRELDPAAASPGRLDRSRLPATDDEVQELADALGRYSERLSEFIAREREFTRDASHELRSPLTVIRVSSASLLADERLSDAGRRAAERIHRAANDMDELTSAFLLLARESGAGLPTAELCVNDVVADELARASLLAEGKPIESRLVASHRVYVCAHERVLSALIGNLLRNAFSYTDRGEVEVTINDRVVTIRDTGVGISADRLESAGRPFVRGESAQRGGHGVGLSIVRRLSDRFGWPVLIDSEVGVGTRIDIRFPAARSDLL